MSHPIAENGSWPRRYASSCAMVAPTSAEFGPVDSLTEGFSNGELARVGPRIPSRSVHTLRSTRAYSSQILHYKAVEDCISRALFEPVVDARSSHKEHIAWFSVVVVQSEETRTRSPSGSTKFSGLPRRRTRHGIAAKGHGLRGTRVLKAAAPVQDTAGYGVDSSIVEVAQHP